MTSAELLSHLFGRGKLSTRHVSEKMGRSSSYLSRYIYRKSSPSSEILSEILDTIGWELVARNRSTGEEIPIDPPKRE